MTSVVGLVLPCLLFLAALGAPLPGQDEEMAAKLEQEIELISRELSEIQSEASSPMALAPKTSSQMRTTLMTNGTTEIPDDVTNTTANLTESPAAVDVVDVPEDDGSATTSDQPDTPTTPVTEPAPIPNNEAPCAPSTAPVQYVPVPYIPPTPTMGYLWNWYTNPYPQAPLFSRSPYQQEPPPPAQTAPIAAESQPQATPPPAIATAAPSGAAGKESVLQRHKPDKERWLRKATTELPQSRRTTSIEIETKQGVVRCSPVFSANGGVHQCFGIPYAHPPVGQRRFRNPDVSDVSWSGKLDARQPHPGCVRKTVSSIGSTEQTMSEDCLVANVFMPMSSDTRKLPVFVFVHGGAFQGGSAGAGTGEVTWGTSMTGSAFADEHDAVVVTFNYRLGPLGFISVEGKDTVDKEAVKGNYGFYDQQALLRWVQDNIASYGGDKDRVTLGGHSAGAMSVMAHMVSPQSEGLFHRAVMFSPASVSLRNSGDEKSTQYAKVFASKTGCLVGDKVDMECLRTVDEARIDKAFGKACDEIWGLHSVGSVMKQQMTLPFGIEVDGDGVPVQVLRAWQADRQMKIPVIWGFTEDEAFPMVKVVGSEKLSMILAGVFKKNSNEKIATFYQDRFHSPVRNSVAVEMLGMKADDATTGVVAATIATDSAFKCPLLNVSASHPASQPIYQYKFAYTRALGKWPSCENRACHGEDVPMWIDPGSTGRETQEAKQLESQMVDYLSNFISAGDPNAEGMQRWDPVSVQNPSRALVLNSTVYQQDVDMNWQCGVWNDADVGYMFESI